MWIIIKYKTKEINLVFNNLKKVIGEMPEFCIPKIKYTRYFGKKIKLFKVAETRTPPNSANLRKPKRAPPNSACSGELKRAPP